MTTKHAGAAFNHSCLKVPVNPENNRPLPTFERKRVSDYLEEVRKEKEVSRHDRTRSCELLHASDRPSSSDSREVLSKISISQCNANSTLQRIGDSANTESLKSFIDFYENIPDYRDLNHLSDREFHVRLEYLKEKRRNYLRDLDEKDFGTVEMEEENKINTRKNLEKKTSATSKTWLRYADSVTLQDKKCDLDDKSPVPLSLEHLAEPEKYLDSGDSSLFRNKLGSKNSTSPCPTVSALSLKDSQKSNIINSPKSNIHLNNYVFDTEEPKSVSRIGMVSNKTLEKDSKFKSPLPGHKLYRIKAKKPNGTNKIRDTHFIATNTASLLTGDNSSSIIDNLWDDFTFDDYVPNADLFSDSDSEQDEALDLAVSHSVPNSLVLKQNKNVAWQEPKITIPKPFNMTLREEEDRHVNLLHYRLYGDDSSDEAKEKSRVIKAHQVPLESQLPLFDKIMADQENRRQKVRRQCMNELRAQMKPFKFMKRDEASKLLRICHSSPDLRDFGNASSKLKPFRAKPVPKNLFSNYVYQRMREDEYYRSLKKKIRAEELLKSASLPPSMAARERLSKAKALSTEVLNTVPQRPKRRKHKCLNYKKKHEQIQKELEERCSNNITTSPQPFTLRTSELHRRKPPKFTSLDDSCSISPYKAYSPQNHVRPQSTLGIPLNRNNLASILRIQSSRQRMEQELTIKQEENRKKEEVRFKAHITRSKPAWQALNYSTEEDLAVRIQTRREEERIRREEYEQDMHLMLNRVEQIPTLFERQSQPTMKEVHRNHRKPHRKSEHRMKISSIPVTPDLYEDDERQNNNAQKNEIADEKNTKIKLNVSIMESPKIVQCSAETEDVETIEVRKQDENDQHHVLNEEEGEKKHMAETGKIKVEDEKEDESAATVNSHENISACGSTDEDADTYTIDEEQ